jgi:hypothetical protein
LYCVRCVETWEKKSGKKATECHAVDCRAKKNIVGGIVKNLDTPDNTIYIVPLCINCSNRPGEFYVEGPLIPIN